MVSVPVAARERTTSSTLVVALLLASVGCAPSATREGGDPADADAADAAADATLGDDVLPDASACAALIAACQAPSVVSTQAAWCHLLGHAGDETRCQASLSSCLVTCAEEAGVADAAAADAFAPADAADALDAAAAPVTCASYCTCMSLQCAAFPGYPFADTAACLAKCAAFAPAELACFAYFCDDTKKWIAYPTLVQHECDHALGGYGVAECPAT